MQCAILAHETPAEQSARDDAIITTDPDGRILSWSPGAEAVLGWTAAEIEGRSIAVTFVPEDRAHGVPADELEQAVARGLAADIQWHQWKDGSRVFIDGSTRALHRADGTLRGFLEIGQDLTRRRELDEAVRRPRSRSRAWWRPHWTASRRRRSRTWRSAPRRRA